jgi:hypothetical protein
VENPSRVSVGVSQITLTGSTPVTVIVNVVDDAAENGSANYTVRLKAATSTDTRYAGQDASDVTVTVIDND